MEERDTEERREATPGNLAVHPRRLISQASPPRGHPCSSRPLALTPRLSLLTSRLYLPSSPRQLPLCIIGIHVSCEPSTHPTSHKAIDARRFVRYEGYKGDRDTIPALGTRSRPGPCLQHQASSLPPASCLCVISELPGRVPGAHARFSCSTSHKAKLSVDKSTSPSELGAGSSPSKLRFSKPKHYACSTVDTHELLAELIIDSLSS